MNYTQGQMPTWAKMWNGLLFGMADVVAIAWAFRFSMLVTLIMLWAIFGRGMGTPLPDIQWPEATNDAPSAVSNAPAPTPEPVAVSADLVAAGSFVRPAISIYKGTFTVAADGPNLASVWVYRLVNGKWIGGRGVAGSDATAGRTYGCGVAGDITVFRFGAKGGHGTWSGPGLIMPDGRVIRTGLSTGVGRLALDGSGLVLMGKDAAWARVDQSRGALTQRGQWKGLTTGEKLAFTASGSTWACSMGGFSKQDSSVAIGDAHGCKVTAVAAYSAYPSMSDDPNWPSVALCSGTVWFASAYSGRLRVNSVTAGKARWPIGSLADLGPCAKGDRCPPRLVTVQGRPVAIYEAPGRAIMRQEVPDGRPIRIATGSQPAATVDAKGRIHLVWIDGAALKYKAL